MLRRRGGPLPAILGLFLLLPALAACADDDGVPLGAVIQARDDSPVGTSEVSGTIALPTGRLSVEAGAPLTQLPASRTRDRATIEAPAGSAFIPLTWHYAADDVEDYAAYLQSDASPVIELSSAGASYRLGSAPASGESDSFFVLVKGSGDEANLAVDFDGVVQTVDLRTGAREPGRAKDLYRLKARRTGTSSCAGAADFDVSALARVTEFECEVTEPARIPYASGAWAAEGMTWLVVTVRTTLTRYDEVGADLKSGAVFGATKVKQNLRGTDPTPTTVVEDPAGSPCRDVLAGCTTLTHLIFAIAKDAPNPTELVLRQNYTLKRVSTWGASDAADHLKLGGSIRIPLA